MRIFLFLLLCSCTSDRWFDAALAPCATGAPAPATIDAVLEHLDGLPANPTIPCVVASLPRPLQLVATRNNTSAQPATETDPRVFILSGDMTYAVVGSGRGATLFELSEKRGPRLSLKAELVFPLTPPVSADDAYVHLFQNEQLTSCGFCHHEERLDEAQPGKAVSRALRPEETTLVPLSDLVDALKTCDRTTERCLLLAALVGFGPFTEGKFPDTWATFGEP